MKLNVSISELEGCRLTLYTGVLKVFHLSNQAHNLGAPNSRKKRCR